MNLTLRRIRTLSCLAVLLGATVLLIAMPARAEVVALWRFEPDALTEDSSGNGHTLASLGVAEGISSPAPGSTGSALFNGTGIMNTVDLLDLTAFNKVRVSWWQRVPGTTGGILFEHSQNTNFNKGGFFASVNLQGPGKSAITARNINDQGPGIPRFNTDDLNHGTVGEWEEIAVEFTFSKNVLGTNVIRVYKAGIFEAGTDRGTPNTDIAPFLNDTFYIGGRNPVSLPFTGNIDELMIEGFVVPEPGTATMTGMMVLGFAVAGRRWRSYGGQQ